MPRRSLNGPRRILTLSLSFRSRFRVIPSLIGRLILSWKRQRRMANINALEVSSGYFEESSSVNTKLVQAFPLQAKRRRVAEKLSFVFSGRMRTVTSHALLDRAFAHRFTAPALALRTMPAAPSGSRGGFPPLAPTPPYVPVGIRRFTKNAQVCDARQEG